jgi:GH25 family lysozyme M1 (1,4-beta-N-acetylmuramidase)
LTRRMHALLVLLVTLSAMASVPAQRVAAVETPPGPGKGDPSLTHSPQMLQLLSGGRRSEAPAATMWPQGLDVASYQHANGDINWSQVAGSGYRFAYIKATEGTYYGNPYLASDLSRAKGAGLFAGAYHFAIPNGGDATNQADSFLNGAGYVADGQTLPPMLDVEWDPYDSNQPCYGLSRSAMVNWIAAFGAEVQRRTGRLPLIYTAAGWWNQCTGGSSSFAAYPLSVASWGASTPTLPTGWSSWTVWQYTSSGPVPGIAGAVDLDSFNGDVDQLADFAGGSPSRPAVGLQGSTGELDLFWKGRNGNLWDAARTSSAWGAAADLGDGPLGSAPALGVHQDTGKRDVLWRGQDGNLWEAYRANNAWNGPSSLGMGPLGSEPTVGVHASGEVDVFWRGQDGNLWETFWAYNVWNGPYNLGMGPLGSQPAVGVHADTGEQDVFWKGQDGSLWESFWAGSGWNGPYRLGMGPLGSEPSVGVHSGSGEQDVFWRGTDRGLWEGFWDGSAWRGPVGLGMGPLGSGPAVAVHQDTGEQDVFWKSQDSAIWGATWAGGPWSGPSSLGVGT